MIDTSGNNNINNINNNSSASNNSNDDNNSNNINNNNNSNSSYFSYSYYNSGNNKALKRKIEDSPNSINNNNSNNSNNNNNQNDQNEFELQEFNSSKRLEIFNENDGGIMNDNSENVNNIGSRKRNEEFSFDYCYNYSMNNRFISRRNSEMIDLTDQEDNLNDSSSSLGLNTPIQSLTVQSPQFNVLNSPMSLSFSQFITPQPPPTYSILSSNNTINNNTSNINNNSITTNINNYNSINTSSTTSPLKNSKPLSNSTIITNNNSINSDNSSNSLSSSNSSKDEEELVDSTPIANKSFDIDAPADPYDIDPVLKEQLLTEERLERERKEAANPPQPEFDHLVFIIHGIGNQGSENRVQTLEQNVALLKKNCELFQKDNSSKKLNVEFQIIEWHSKLRNNDNLNNNLEKISPVGVKKIRDFINETLLDVLLYMSPMYHQEILNEVSNQINEGYKSFLEKNKAFKGSMSIFAHSLGSVITWDILSNGLIDFSVENVFALGSPLGMFLTIKGTPLGSLKFEEVMPCCTKWFNVFSPTDPVGYRIEPFFDTKYLEYDPCLIEVEVDKKPLKQKLSGFFFKSTTTTTNKDSTKTVTTKEEVSPTTGTLKSTTTTTTTNLSTQEKDDVNELTTTTTINSSNNSSNNSSTSNSINNSPTSNTQIIDLTDDSDEIMQEKEIQMEKDIANASRRFKVHPLEPDSPTLFKDSDAESLDDSLVNSSSVSSKSNESSFRSKFLMTISNVQKSMQKVNGTSSSGSNRSSLKEEVKIKDSNNINNDAVTTTTTTTIPGNTNSTTSAAPSKSMVKEILTLSLTKDSDSCFDKYENRFDFNIEETSSFLPYYISSLYSHIEYWNSKSTALFITKKLLHTKNKLASKPSSPSNS